MKVIIACEFSGVARRAFRELGHDAWSCDLLPSEDNGEHHLIGDVRSHLHRGWDLMIAHPPCQYLSRVAVRWLDRPGRREAREDAMLFFMELWHAPIARVCIENPVGYPWQAFRRPDQQIDPYQFGHVERKRTCLWTRGLPLLVPTSPDALPPQHLYVGSDGNKRFTTAAIGGKVSEKWKKRARTYSGIAAAMAAQWGSLDDLILTAS